MEQKNREIKFRAWNTEINKMGSALPLKVWTDDIATEIGRKKYLRDKDNIILMQFTGLKDKTGKEIYEGDILRWRVRERLGGFCEQLDVVEFLRGSFITRQHNGDRNYENDIESVFDDGNYEQITKESTVIGNIYENPELIDKKS